MELKEVRLLHLFKSLNIGGVEKSTIIYSNHLSGDLAFVGIFAKKGIYDHSNIVSQKIGLVHPPLNIELNILSSPLYLIRLANTIIHFRINVIVYHQRIFVPLIWFIRLVFRKIKIIYTAHNVFGDYKNLFLTSDAIIAVSEAVRKDLERSDKKNIRVLLHGVDLNTQVRESRTRTNIGYVGRFEKSKGLPFLLKSFQLLRETNKDCKLIIRGDGPSRNDIIRLISELNLERYAVIEPPKLLEQEIYGDIDILVLPSLRLEGCGIVLIEAMREGIPVVGTNTSGINEVIEDGYNGKLAEPGNVSQLAEAIREILGDRKMRDELVANGKKTLKEKFDIQRYLSDYRQLLARL